jgi:ribulose-5-phosphate 4-epimerase/fuculose-1-phosphate aldolase
MQAEIQEDRNRVAVACRILGMLELSTPIQGHVSCRLPGEDKCLIRARGPQETGLLYTTPNEVLIVDFDGQIVDGSDGLTAPLEVYIHTALYKARPEINSVVHIHPSIVVLFTICDAPLLPIIGAYNPQALGLVLNERLSRYDRSILIRTPELGADLASHMGQTDLCMMRGHGITAVGHDVQEATVNAINLAELATMNYKARLLGNPRPISDDDQDEFARMLRGRIAPPGTIRKPPQIVYNLWRFYERRLQDFDARGELP